VGSSFIDVLAKFEADPETEYVVMVGEIGGDEEEKAARFIQESMSKPVLAYIAGFTAPPGQDDGPRGRDHLRLVGTARQEGDARGLRRHRKGRRRPRSRSSVADVARGGLTDPRRLATRPGSQEAQAR
jgi:succinyl-CoA synthetase alpha subunit